MTTQAIATIGPRDYTPEQVALIKAQIAPGASDSELKLFVAVSRQLGLDPFKRQLYAIQRAGKMTIQVSVDGLLALAERSNRFGGITAAQFCGPDAVWSDVWLSKTPPAAAKIGVKRDDWQELVWAVAVWTEFYQDNPMWKAKPSHMLEKCALAKALRRAFPNEFREVSEATDVTPDDEYLDVDTDTGEVQATESPTAAAEPQDAPVAPPPVQDTTEPWRLAAASCWTKVKATAAELGIDPVRLRFYLATDKGVPEKLTESTFKAWLDAAPGRDFDQLYVLWFDGERNAAPQPEPVQGELA